MKRTKPVHEIGYVAFAQFPADDQMLPHGFTGYIISRGATDCESTVATSIKSQLSTECLPS